jgi:hypothetical protein
MSSFYFARSGASRILDTYNTTTHGSTKGSLPRDSLLTFPL